MRPSIESLRGRLALMVSNCAGMVDMIALPVWMGTLVAHRHLDPQQAGGLVTLFLLSGVIASLVFAPLLQRLSARGVATAGYLGSALAFVGMWAASDYLTMAALHAFGGFCTGAALSVTLGTIGRSANPHRLFAMAGATLGVFALAFLGLVPVAISAHGGDTLFAVFAFIMLVAALGCATAYPPEVRSVAARHRTPLPRQVWGCIGGMTLMALLQATAMAFIERIGMDRGFGESAVHGVLLAIGLVNLLPAPLAALLEKRLPPLPVVLCGPVLQVTIALVLSLSTQFAPYAMAAALLTSVTIFTHTFVFGLLSRLDSTGRAAAATPAMTMTGGAIGPILGGTIVKAWGYPALGGVCLAIALAALCCFSLVRARRHAAMPA